MSAGSDRLERSRLAILEHIHRKDLRRHPPPAGAGEAAPAQADASAVRRGRRGRWYGATNDIVGSWWRYHPAHTALDLARPALASYARRKPAQYLGLAALAGAALFFMRPWKLISVTGVLLALVKSPQVASLVMQALSGPRDSQEGAPLPE